MLTHNELNYWLLAVGILTAAGTIGLAIATFRMVKKTRDLAVQEDRHHQDEAMPICLLNEVAGNRANIVKFEGYKISGQPVFQYEIYGPLRNIGQGPALNVRLILRFPTFNNHEVIHELDPLGAGETSGVHSAINTPPFSGIMAAYNEQLAADAARHIATIPIAPTDGFNDAAMRGSGGAWGDIFLEYTDIFGNHFYTQHTKNPQHQWMQFGNGTRPAAIAAPAISSSNRPTQHT